MPIRQRPIFKIILWGFSLIIMNSMAFALRLPPDAHEKDYYATMGVERDATAEQLKGAWKKLVARLHPDKHSEKRGSEHEAVVSKFQELGEAYDVLSDVELRRQYDLLTSGGSSAQARPKYSNTYEDFQAAEAREREYVERAKARKAAALAQVKVGYRQVKKDYALDAKFAATLDRQVELFYRFVASTLEASMYVDLLGLQANYGEVLHEQLITDLLKFADSEVLMSLGIELAKQDYVAEVSYEGRRKKTPLATHLAHYLAIDEEIFELSFRNPGASRRYRELLLQPLILKGLQQYDDLDTKLIYEYSKTLRSVQSNSFAMSAFRNLVDPGFSMLRYYIGYFGFSQIGFKVAVSDAFTLWITTLQAIQQIHTREQFEYFEITLKYMHEFKFYPDRDAFSGAAFAPLDQYLVNERFSRLTVLQAFVELNRLVPYADARTDLFAVASILHGPLNFEKLRELRSHFPASPNFVARAATKVGQLTSDQCRRFLNAFTAR